LKMLGKSSKRRANNLNSLSGCPTTALTRTVSFGSVTRYVYDNHNNHNYPAGTNVVAIDNKIEQAMDLVKTHLMYAVREEVEVLKDKISDLEKKVYRLEWENQILRESASPEVLQQIQLGTGTNQQTIQSATSSTQNISSLNLLAPLSVGSSATNISQMGGTQQQNLGGPS